jgi:hypothetical protein
VTLGHGACSAVPTAALPVGTADLPPRINRYVGAAFAHPTDCGSCRRQHMIRISKSLNQCNAKTETATDADHCDKLTSSSSRHETVSGTFDAILLANLNFRAR